MPYPATGAPDLQRLFSTFANGWPGIGLLLQRVLVAALLARSAMAHLNGTFDFASIVLPLIATAGGILLLVGLWTPVVGILVAVTQICIAFSQAGDPWTSVEIAILAATLAMIGPGAWSIDARLFGRERIEIGKP